MLGLFNNSDSLWRAALYSVTTIREHRNRRLTWQRPLSSALLRPSQQAVPQSLLRSISPGPVFCRWPRSEEQQRLLLHELNHGVKNTRRESSALLTKRSSRAHCRRSFSGHPRGGYGGDVPAPDLRASTSLALIDGRRA